MLREDVHSCTAKPLGAHNAFACFASVCPLFLHEHVCACPPLASHSHSVRAAVCLRSGDSGGMCPHLTHLRTRHEFATIQDTSRRHNAIATMHCAFTCTTKSSRNLRGEHRHDSDTSSHATTATERALSSNTTVLPQSISALLVVR